MITSTGLVLQLSQYTKTQLPAASNWLVLSPCYVGGVFVYMYIYIYICTHIIFIYRIGYKVCLRFGQSILKIHKTAGAAELLCVQGDRILPGACEHSAA